MLPAVVLRHLPRPRLVLLLGLAANLALLAAGPARPSAIVARNATDVSLSVNAEGRAVVFYRIGGRLRHPLFWDAVDARHPDRGVAQVAFRRDYSGGWGTFRRPIWRTIRNACRPYDGPPLPYLVTACKAPDGSYWALQAWRRLLPSLGVEPWKPSQRAVELRLSHWTGEPARLEVWLDWVQSRKFHHLFGRFTYRGTPVYGFAATPSGSPLDGYGRNLFLDTLNSAYGPGWRRENGFLTHRPNGNFCYGFYSHRPYPGYPDVGRRPAGHGERYRITVDGPGVTPVVVWEGAGLPDYDRRDPEHVEHERKMNVLAAQLAAGDESSTSCRDR